MSHTFSLVGKQLAFTHSRKIPLLLNNECKHAPRLSQDVAPLHLSFLKFHLHFFNFLILALSILPHSFLTFLQKTCLLRTIFAVVSSVELICVDFSLTQLAFKGNLIAAFTFFCNSLDARWA